MTLGRIYGGASGGGSGSVTSVSVVSTNGFAGSVADPTAAAAITLNTTVTGLLQGNGSSVAAASTTGSGNVVLATSPTITTPTIASFANANHTHLNGAGGGTLTAAAITDFDTQVRTNRLDQMAQPSGSVSMNSQKITSLLDPTSAQDAATKSYADAIASGLLVKASCNYASTADVPGTYVGTPTFTLTEVGVGALSIDGASPDNGDRVLLKNQSTATQNGIYVVTDKGSAGTPYVLTRASDFDSSGEILTGDYTFVALGTANAATGFILTTTAPITLDTTALSFTQFSSATNYVAGAGLTLTGLTFAVGAGTGIVSNADDVAVDTTVVATTSNSLTMSNKTLTSPVLTTPSVTGGTQGSVLFYNGSAQISQDNGTLFFDDTNNFFGIGTSTPTAELTILQGVKSSGSPSAVRIVGAANTTLAASTEANDIYLKLDRTVQYSTGALALQRAVYLTAPTYSFVGASTLSTAATFSVSSSPVAGTNATITRSYSMMSENGNVCFTMSGNTGLVVDFLGANTAQSSRTVSFKSACGANAAGPDFTFYTTGITRVAGTLFAIANNATQRFGVAYTGGVLISQGVSSAGSAYLLSATGGAHTSLAASVESSDVSFNLSRTVQFTSGALTTQRAFWISAPTYSFTSSSTITGAATFYVSGCPSTGANSTITNAAVIAIDGSSTLASTANLTYAGYSVNSHTLTLTGSTNVTSTAGISGVKINRVTVTDSSAVTVTNAASLYIDGEPLAAGSVTLTNSYAILVNLGISRFNGAVSLGSRLLQNKGADVASAGDLTLGGDGNCYVVTGVTTINAISTTNWVAGSQVTLIFSGSLTVNHNTAGGAGTARIFLAGSANLSTSANTVLTLVYDGTQFQEVSRKVP